ATNAGLARRYDRQGALLAEAWLLVPGDPNFVASIGKDALVPVGGSVVRLAPDGAGLGRAGGLAGAAGVGGAGRARWCPRGAGRTIGAVHIEGPRRTQRGSACASVPSSSPFFSWPSSRRSRGPM